MSLKEKIKEHSPNFVLLLQALYVALKRSQIRPSLFLGLNRPYAKSLSCRMPGCACSQTSFVWVSHTHKLIFFEIPKAASSSVKDAFNIVSTPRIRAVHLAKHMKAENMRLSLWRRLGLEAAFAAEMDYAQAHVDDTEVSYEKSAFSHLYMSPDEALEAYPDYTSFAAVRDPIARGVSAYKMFCQRQNPFRSGQGVLTFNRCPWTMTLSDYIDRLYSHPNHHFMPQADYLPSDPSRVDYFLRTEHMAEDAKAFSEKTGVDLVVGHKNATFSKVNIAPEDKEHLYDFYRKDFDGLPYEYNG